MEKKLSKTPSSHAFPRALVVGMLFGILCPMVQGKDFRIKVFNARNGKPITNECLNVWIGRMQGESSLLPTDNEGMILLHLADGQLTANAVVSRACNGPAFVGPKLIAGRSDSIYITGGHYVPCQEYGEIVPGDAPTPNLVQKLMPPYSIRKILESGVTASNTCGKFRAEAKPGELILFVRPRSFWERLRE